MILIYIALGLVAVVVAGIVLFYAAYGIACVGGLAFIGIGSLLLYVATWLGTRLAVTCGWTARNPHANAKAAVKAVFGRDEEYTVPAQWNPHRGTWDGLP